VTPTPTAQPAFPVRSVRDNFRAECIDHVVVDELFCLQIIIDGMTADGTTLVVPTRLDASELDRAADICALAASAHINNEGNDLGFGQVRVLDQTGGDAASCR